MVTETDFPGQSGDWRGHPIHRFTLDGVPALLVSPHSPDSARNWIWRARFFDAWPAADLALLSRGFHLACIDVADLFGNREAMRRFDRLYAFLTHTLSLNARPVLEGFSRGGLAVYNWASRNPDKVCCIYADAPVCDIRSWPGGLGQGQGSPDNWRKCLAAHGIAESEVETFRGNPIDLLAPLARAGIPLLHVCGEADKAVPVSENTDVLRQRYEALGGRISVLLKPGCGHHPHSLEDPGPIVRFVLEAVAAGAR